MLFLTVIFPNKGPPSHYALSVSSMATVHSAALGENSFFLLSVVFQNIRGGMLQRSNILHQWQSCKLRDGAAAGRQHEAKQPTLESIPNLNCRL